LPLGREKPRVKQPPVWARQQGPPLKPPPAKVAFDSPPGLPFPLAELWPPLLRPPIKQPPLFYFRDPSGVPTTKLAGPTGRWPRDVFLDRPPGIEVAGQGGQAGVGRTAPAGSGEAWLTAAMLVPGLVFIPDWVELPGEAHLEPAPEVTPVTSVGIDWHCSGGRPSLPDSSKADGHGGGGRPSLPDRSTADGHGGGGRPPLPDNGQAWLHSVPEISPSLAGGGDQGEQWSVEQPPLVVPGSVGKQPSFIKASAIKAATIKPAGISQPQSLPSAQGPGALPPPVRVKPPPPGLGLGLLPYPPI